MKKNLWFFAGLWFLLLPGAAALNFGTLETGYDSTPAAADRPEGGLSGDYRLRLTLPVWGGRFTGALTWENPPESRPDREGGIKKISYSFSNSFLALGHFQPRGAIKDLILPALNRDLSVLNREAPGFAPDRSYAGSSRTGAAVFLPGGAGGFFFYGRPVEETGLGGWGRLSFPGPGEGTFRLTGAGLLSLPREREPPSSWILETLYGQSRRLYSLLLDLDLSYPRLSLGVNLRGIYGSLDGPGGFVRAYGAWASRSLFSRLTLAAASPLFFKPDGTRMTEFLGASWEGRFTSPGRAWNFHWKGEENQHTLAVYPRGEKNFRPYDRRGVIGLRWRRRTLSLAFAAAAGEEGDRGGSRTRSFDLNPSIRWQGRAAGAAASFQWVWDPVLWTQGEFSFWAGTGVLKFHSGLTLRKPGSRPKLLFRLSGRGGPWVYRVEACLNREAADIKPPDPVSFPASLGIFRGGLWDLRLSLSFSL
ncbi:MAG: hypothetical protein LBQ61_09930 [Spirochaetales bacterium]|jgi:hypothetical protein|nr:hypothetical protein [Spirochaetales bacterium]